MRLLERDEALTTLAAAWESARRGEGRLVVISGEAGIGKTALVEAFTRQPGLRTLWGACDNLYTPRPLGPFHDIAQQLGGDWPQRLLAETNPQRLASAMLGELQLEPTLLVIEDAHWADEASLDLLRYVGRRVARTVTLMLVTVRDDELGPSHPLRSVLQDLTPLEGVTRLALPPFSLQAVAQLLGKRHQEASRLLEQTGGNPFFVSEVLAAGETHAPASVRDVLLARWARLPADAQRVLQAAAVLGPRIEAWALQEVTSPSPAALEACLTSGMLLAQGDGYTFRHELGRETVLTTLAPTQRLTLHQQALACLRANPRTAQSLARLAHHAQAAGDLLAVHEFAPAAAREAARAGAHREAAQLYALAVRDAHDQAPHTRATLLEAFAEESNAIDERQTALQARRQALVIWQQLGERTRQCEALAHISAIASGLGQAREAEAAIDQALTLLGVLPVGRAHALVFRVRAGLHMLNLNPHDAIAWAERSIFAAQTAGDLPIEVAARVILHSAHMELDFDRARQAMEATITQALEQGLDALAALGYTNLSAFASQHLRLKDADQWAQTSVAYASERGQERLVLYTQAWHAFTLMRLGQWDLAVDVAERVANRPGVSATARLTALAALGTIRARRGDPGVREALDLARDLADPTLSLQRTAPVYAARAEAAWLAGNRRQTQAEARSVYALALEKQHPWFAGELAYWLQRAGGAVEAQPWMALPWRAHLAGDWRAAAEAWRALGCPYEQARALADGDRRAQAEALAVFDQLGTHLAADGLRQRLALSPAAKFGLTERQLDILAYLVEGLTNAEIATRLNLSPKTVDHHVSAVLAKLDVRTRAEAAALMRAGR
jgi:DNA-binding CsgD family transcriptional regulator